MWIVEGNAFFSFYDGQCQGTILSDPILSFMYGKTEDLALASLITKWIRS